MFDMPGSRRSRWRPVAVVLSILGAACAVAACGSPARPAAPPPAAPPVAAPASSLTGLAEVAVRRIQVGDKVAAAKFGSPAPIDDPPREQQVLAAAAGAAPQAGVDPSDTTRFFRDQIEASKVVQRGLYDDWNAHPDHRPTTRPDLKATVRPELDQITTEIMRQLRATASVRHDPAQCGPQLAAATSASAAPLDQLHRAALDVALRSVCPAGH